MSSKVRVTGRSLVVGNSDSGKELDSETSIPESWRNQSPSGPVEGHLKKMNPLSEIIRNNQRST